MKKMRLFWLMVMVFTVSQGCVHSSKENDKYPPSIRTLEPEEITANSALLQGEITSLGTESIIRKGFCWLPEKHLNTPRWPTVNDSIVEITQSSNPFTFTLSDLVPRSTYYVRAFVETSLGIVYGENIDFMTDYETVTDIDGNVYTIVKIGNQYWTRENFKATRLRDGTPIPNWTEGASWGSGAPKEPAMCWYENNREKYETPYGALYNWHAASHPLIAPEGWKVPHLEDYEELDKTLGSHAGGRMKIPGTAYWKAPNTGATNDSEFSAYPAGGRDDTSFAGLNYSALFWTSSSYTNSTNLADCTMIQWNSPHLYVTVMSMTYTGYSLRLVKED